MSDYQKKYGIMVRASEKAVRILIEAQRQCEERALKEENELIFLPTPDKDDLSSV